MWEGVGENEVSGLLLRDFCLSGGMPGRLSKRQGKRYGRHCMPRGCPTDCHFLPWPNSTYCSDNEATRRTRSSQSCTRLLRVTNQCTSQPRAHQATLRQDSRSTSPEHRHLV